MQEYGQGMPPMQFWQTVSVANATFAAPSMEVHTPEQPAPSWHAPHYVLDGAVGPSMQTANSFNHEREPHRCASCH